MTAQGFTLRALKEEYVRVEGESVYFDKVPNGDYLATGHDVDGKRISRRYTVNSRVDRQSVWAMWNDFNGRWGLTRIWHITDEGKRILLYQN